MGPEHRKTATIVGLRWPQSALGAMRLSVRAVVAAAGVFLLLPAPTAALSGPALSSSSYARHQVLDSMMSVHWTCREGHVEVLLDAGCPGWVGFGVSRENWVARLGGPASPPALPAQGVLFPPILTPFSS